MIFERKKKKKRSYLFLQIILHMNTHPEAGQEAAPALPATLPSREALFIPLSLSPPSLSSLSSLSLSLSLYLSLLSELIGNWVIHFLLMFSDDVRYSFRQFYIS